MMPNKIYLSGPDGAGKSTLAAMFEKAGYKIVKWSKPLPDEDEKTWVAKAIEQIMDPTPMVFDRGWFGDIIYAPVFGSKPVITEADAIRLLDVFTKTYGGQLIYVKAHAHVLYRRLAFRGDDYVVPSQMPDILAGYEKWFQKLAAAGIPFTVMDTTHSFSNL